MQYLSLQTMFHQQEKQNFSSSQKRNQGRKHPLGLARSFEGIRGLSNLLLGIQDNFSLQVWRLSQGSGALS